jgi:hypothetical protein
MLMGGFGCSVFHGKKVKNVVQAVAWRKNRLCP